jgi:DNA-binding response OmpR family regulator
MTKRVLIAEDEESIVASLEFLMRRAGFETCVARDGPTALARIADFAPDLVLLDIMLPGQSGYDVCARIRANPKHAATRVLMLTARGSNADEARGMASGADGYLTKPFDGAALVAGIRAVLGLAAPTAPS